MTKLSTIEFTGSALLMTLVSSPGADKSKVMERLLASAGHREKATPHDKVYDVRVSVNGIELDWVDFAAHVNESFDSWVAQAAGEIVREKLNPKFFELTERIESALGDLANLAESETAKLLGLEPKHGDR